MRPNLFCYATKELSQDAFICWLLAWADKECASEDGNLNALGLSLVNKILEIHGKPPLTARVAVKVHRQLMRADIVAEVDDESGAVSVPKANKSFVILIEDKIHAGLNGDQLTVYLGKARARFEPREVIPIFLKTGDQSSYEAVEMAQYHVLLRDQILELLRTWKGRISDAIFSDFLDNLECREAQVESYATKPVSVWTTEWDPWKGFYKRLQRELSDRIQWDDVPNASGGFLGAWWHMKAWKDPESGINHTVYLLIAQGPLCFKIGVNKAESDKAAVRERWRGQLTETATELGLRVARPARLGCGSDMTVGRIELKDWMAKRSDGLIDIPSSLAALRNAASVLDQAAGSR